jgi:multicomponent K+:H+ antiporter subunit F
MNSLLAWALTFSHVCLAIAAACAAMRVVIGPRAQDRVLGLDTLYTNVILLILTFGIRHGTALYFEAALIIALTGFVATTALAKFLVRGEVIE